MPKTPLRRTISQTDFEDFFFYVKKRSRGFGDLKALCSQYLLSRPEISTKAKSLERRIERRLKKKKNEKLDRRAHLQPIDSIQIARVLCSLDSLMIHPTKSMIIDYARSLKGLGVHWRGDKWWNRFKKEHQNDFYTQRWFKSIERSRISVTLEEEVEEWIKRRENLFSGTKFPPDMYHNFDEFCVSVNQNSFVCERLKYADGKIDSDFRNREGLLGSLGIFTSASGKLVMSVWCLKGKTLKEQGFVSAEFQFPKKKMYVFFHG